MSTILTMKLLVSKFHGRTSNGLACTMPSQSASQNKTVSFCINRV